MTIKDLKYVNTCFNKKNIDNNQIVVSNKVYFSKKGFKYFIGYFIGYISPRMIAYRRDFDETKYMSFLIKDDELLEKYNEIW